ncbi:PQQ-binding-like beta-propeller repeat protein [Haladaptatus sp. CMAA 1911]|uniref:outer membrane protein assembly factor BamB family protein n=1 Tax=unclassified Haladaptatus TaxID=2622732 RepID=UPI0037551814
MRPPSRREFLAALGTVATISATAGCMSTESRSDDAAYAAGDRTDWPTAGHDGVNTGYNPNGRGPRSAPSVAWKTSLGRTTGPPVVAGGRVFVPDAEKIVCYDATDGTKRWEHRPSGDGNIWSAATVRDGTVYVSGPDDSVTAVDAESGTKRQAFETKGRVSAAPRLDSEGESLFVGTSDGWIHCFDLEENEERWQQQVYGEIDAPLALAHDRSLFATTYWGEVYAFSATNGGRMWRRKLPSIITATPTLIQQSLYVPCFKGQVFCLDTNAGAGGTRWKTDRGGNVSTHLAIAGGTVFGVTADELHAVNAESGESRWSFGLSEVSTCSPAVAGDTVYVGDGSGTVYGIKTSGGSGVGDTRFGAKRWKIRLNGPVRDAFAVANGTLFAATDPGENAPMLYALRED